MAATLTHANCPESLEERGRFAKTGKTKAYRKYAGFFSYSVQVVHMECKNVARLFSRFMQNPGEVHYHAIIYALGYLLFCALSDLALAHLKGTLNAANVLTKIDTAANFKREKEWHKRGIHCPKYQAEIKPTLDRLAARAFTWERSLQQRTEKCGAGGEVVTVDPLRAEMAMTSSLAAENLRVD
jgi:hypothetical protein